MVVVKSMKNNEQVVYLVCLDNLVNTRVLLHLLHPGSHSYPILMADTADIPKTNPTFLFTSCASLILQSHNSTFQTAPHAYA